MAIRYQFPCPHCGSKNSVSATLAGQEVKCSHCSGTFEIPQLKVLKELEPTEPVRKAKSIRSSSRPRILFVFGLILCLAGFVSGFLLLGYGKSIRADFSKSDKDIEELADSLAPDAILREWYSVERNSVLPEWQEHPAIRYDTQGRILSQIAFGLLALGGVGLLLLGWGLLDGVRSS